MDRIKKISTTLVRVLVTFSIAVPLFTILLWGFSDVPPLKEWVQAGYLQGGPQGMGESLVQFRDIKWNLSSKLLGVLGGLIALIPFQLGLYSLIRVFQNYKEGLIFTPENARNYGKMAYMFFLDAIITGPISYTIMVLASTFSNPPGERILALALGTPNFQNLFIGFIVLAVSFVMEEASKLQDEIDKTI